VVNSSLLNGAVLVHDTYDSFTLGKAFGIWDVSHRY
jgi:hypothetical protein